MGCFETTAHGKWLLAGEHAVVRGGQALVFPLNSCALTLSTAAIAHKGPYGEATLQLLPRLLQHAAQLIDQPTLGQPAHFHLHSTLPLGAGLGASAALCVVVARWLVHCSIVPKAQLLSMAQQLEDLFHQRSSGVDVLGVSSSAGQLFTPGQPPQALPLAWQPHFYLSYSGHTSNTAACVVQVQALQATAPAQFQALDRQMQAAVAQAQRALALPALQGAPQLVAALALARDCFEQWGLVSVEMTTHEQALRQAGALAVKPTGAGNGGYMLSLWETRPPLEKREQLGLLRA